MTTPNYDGFTLAKLTAKDNAAMYALMNLVRECARRGGTEIALEDIERRVASNTVCLLGGAPGEKAHSLIDKFMTCVHSSMNLGFTCCKASAGRFLFLLKRPRKVSSTR